MKKKLRILSLLMLLLVLLAACGEESSSSAAEIVEPADNFYVSDYADVLESDTISYIQNLNGALEEACGGQIVVVTIDFLGDLDAEQYAYEIINQWGVGDEDENNGVVLLLVPGEGKCWITVGTGLEDALTAGKLETILETWFYDDFDAGDYDAAVYNTVQYLQSWFEDWYGITLDTEAGITPSGEGGREPVYDSAGSYGYEPEPAGYRRGGVGIMLGTLIVFIIIIYLVVGLIGGLFNRMRGGVGFFYFPFFHHRWRGPRGPHDRGGPRGGGAGRR